MVVDTSALAAVLFGEPLGTTLAVALLEDQRRLVGHATLLEATMVVEGRFGPAGGRLLDEFVDAFDIEVVPFEEASFRAAQDAWRRFGKGRHPAALNFGDCFTYGVAAALGEPILCIGNDFGQTDAEVVGLG